MNSSTLGGLIKDYRIQKGISQMDIAFDLGWKETSRLSRIEQGRTEKPTREIIDRIIASIGLQEEEKNTLLLTGGYLPTEEEIENVNEIIKKTLDDWPYPAGVFDFSWRLTNGNKQIIDLYGMSEEEYSAIIKSEFRILDLVFREINLISKHTSLPKEKGIFLQQLVSEFKYEQRHRTKEKWYVNHIKNLMDNKLFREIWISASKAENIKPVLGKHLEKHYINPKNDNKILRFYIFIVPVLQDPRFEIELHVPINNETYAFYENK